ncbi:MAG: fructose bisphosphate aldolase [Clostridium sp.]|jgi:fructose-bisphosphate aldolase class-I|nr:fructose bisphosphate aldolase [Clostridium sp.]CCZ18206.1 putative fructose-bisphosphate aldolase class-I [Clostridium sp. CAG:780]
MNNEMYEIIKNKKGFIAALDQSGGSSSKTLKAYGIDESEYNTEEEMFDLIHEMRKRVFTSKAFTNEHIIGAILFEKTMLSKVNDEYTADYLWNEKRIVSFLKVDKGLAEQANGVKLMKEIPTLAEELREAREKNVFGTKMRSVIYEANEEGIRAVVKQQFEFAKQICDAGLVPIIEPEVDINAPEKEKCEEILKSEVKKQLDSWNEEDKIMFKFTIPTVANHYLDLYDYSCVVRIVALSGGYDVDKAVELLAQNNRMIASFSRALLQDLNVHQTQEEFDAKLNNVIVKIYNASIS